MMHVFLLTSTHCVSWLRNVHVNCYTLIMTNKCSLNHIMFSSIALIKVWQAQEQFHGSFLNIADLQCMQMFKSCQHCPIAMMLKLQLCFNKMKR